MGLDTSLVFVGMVFLAVFISVGLGLLMAKRDAKNNSGAISISHLKKLANGDIAIGDAMDYLKLTNGIEG